MTDPTNCPASYEPGDGTVAPCELTFPHDGQLHQATGESDGDPWTVQWGTS